MTDDRLRNIIRDEFGKIHADENVKAQILKGLTGDTMKTEKRENIITANAENKEKTIVKETNTGGKARVTPRGRIAAAAAALVLCVGGGAYLLRDKDLPDTEASHTSSITDTEDSGSGNIEPVEFDGYFDENGYTVFDKFGDKSEVWRLPNGKFLVRQNASNDIDHDYYYIVFNGETNSVEKVMESSLCNVCVYNNGFSLKDELAKTELGSESTYAEFYDFDLNLVNKFSFNPEETGEVIDAATCASDGSALYVKTSGNGFTGFYKFTNDKGAEPLYVLKVAEKSSTNDIDMLFSSDDGNTLYFIGPNWRENKDDTIETSYRLCAFTAGSCSEFYMPYESKLVLERNNMLYIFSLSSAEYKVYQPDAEQGTNSSYPIGCEYTFGNETSGNKPHLINMSQSGKYVIAASFIADDDGNITDTLLTVYELDGMKEIFTDTISGSVDLMNGGIIFDEATGDICAVRGNINGENGVYTANAFGNEYSNFGMISTDTSQSETESKPENEDNNFIIDMVKGYGSWSISKDDTAELEKLLSNALTTGTVIPETTADSGGGVVNFSLKVTDDNGKSERYAIYVTDEEYNINMKYTDADGETTAYNIDDKTLCEIVRIAEKNTDTGVMAIVLEGHMQDQSVFFITNEEEKKQILEKYNSFCKAQNVPADILNVPMAAGGLYPAVTFTDGDGNAVFIEHSQCFTDTGVCVNGVHYENVSETFIDAMEYYERYKEQGFHEFILPADTVAVCEKTAYLNVRSYPVMPDINKNTISIIDREKAEMVKSLLDEAISGGQIADEPVDTNEARGGTSGYGIMTDKGIYFIDLYDYGNYTITFDDQTYIVDKDCIFCLLNTIEPYSEGGVFNITSDTGSPDGGGSVWFITQSFTKEEVIKWYEDFLAADYAPAEETGGSEPQNSANEKIGGAARHLSFKYNGEKVVISTGKDVTADICVNGKEYYLNDGDKGIFDIIKATTEETLSFSAGGDLSQSNAYGYKAFLDKYSEKYGITEMSYKDNGKKLVVTVEDKNSISEIETLLENHGANLENVSIKTK